MSNHKTHIGIDPGKNGGIAWIFDGKAAAETMPETPKDVISLLREITREEGDAFAILEKVHSSPQMGVRSAFTFGEGFGILRTALAAVEIPFETVSPSRWQGVLKCRTKGDKNVTKRKAQELFPGLEITHAKADALLLAEYGRRMRL